MEQQLQQESIVIENDDEIEIQVFETNSGELIDSTSAIGIVEEDIFDPTFSIDIEAEKFRNYIK